jgi:hypothetical protein
LAEGIRNEYIDLTMIIKRCIESDERIFRGKEEQ